MNDNNKIDKSPIENYYKDYLQNLLLNFKDKYEPSQFADEIIKKRKQINSLIQELIKLRDEYSTNFSKINGLGEEMDYSPPGEDYNILVEIDGVLISVLRSYSQDKFNECEDQLKEAISVLKPLTKKLWIDLCNFKLDKSFSRLHKSIWVKTVNRTSFKCKFDNLKKQLNEKGNPNEFEKFYKEDISNFDYEIQENIRTHKWHGILEICGAIIGSSVLLEIIGHYVSKAFDYIFSIQIPSLNFGTILMIFGAVIITVGVLRLILIIKI
jgi:hypothetical protein